jgi:NAD(P)H-hydrate epimerase
MQKEALTTEEMRILELNCEYLGIDLGTLMQNAGREVAREIAKRTEVQGRKILILSGRGGNGGDGMVAALHLHEIGALVEICLLGSEDRITSRDTEANWNIVKNLDGIHVQELKTESAVAGCSTMDEADIIVDGMLGFGLGSNVREPIKSAVKRVNASDAAIFSIDIPTGIDSDTGKVWGTAVKADTTITMHAPKAGLLKAKEYTGEIVIVPIGMPPEAARICGPGDLSVVAGRRPPHSHKGDYGRILVIGGSDVFSGAPALCGLGALRTGADLVEILAPNPVVPAIRSYSPSMIVHDLGTDVLSIESTDKATKLAEKCDVIAIGPGLGLQKATASAVRKILESITDMEKKIVVDADGLKSIAGEFTSFNAQDSVLTPHWGELSVLLEKELNNPKDLDIRISYALEAASLYNSVVLLKGHIDVVAEPGGQYKLNKTGTPAMTVGGTGDVLTGITAAFLARHENSFTSACASAFVSGVAGEKAFNNLGYHILPTDCIEQIPAAVQSFSH